MAESLPSQMVFTLGLLAQNGSKIFFLKQNQRSGEKKKIFPLKDSDQFVKLFTSCWISWKGNKAIMSEPAPAGSGLFPVTYSALP